MIDTKKKSKQSLLYIFFEIILRIYNIAVFNNKPIHIRIGQPIFVLIEFRTVAIHFYLRRRLHTYCTLTNSSDPAKQRKTKDWL